MNEIKGILIWLSLDWGQTVISNPLLPKRPLIPFRNPMFPGRIVWKNESLFCTTSVPSYSLKPITEYRSEERKESQVGLCGEQGRLSQRRCRNKLSITPQAGAILWHLMLPSGPCTTLWCLWEVTPSREPKVLQIPHCFFCSQPWTCLSQKPWLFIDTGAWEVARSRNDTVAWFTPLQDHQESSWVPLRHHCLGVCASWTVVKTLPSRSICLGISQTDMAQQCIWNQLKKKSISEYVIGFVNAHPKLSKTPYKLRFYWHLTSLCQVLALHKLCAFTLTP